ncbi:N-acyl-D-amino-acid deacylase family protein [Pseudorhodoferax sp.]|uniref:N-acyl-D-amino-acid deacylase family protein n=1 Tax=Pseudorhodoferax sp. TaxID=1993553 RepID=UPI002DD67721|nr:amidohydrolase family protein [Pseudorhodoferax sp.]
MHDLLIRNARIYDGTGAAPLQGDLAVSDGRIAAIAARIDGPARETVDAQGLSLMPGIIDGHTHLDAQLTWDPFANPSPALGVTTVVIGNCGFTIAPCRPEDRDLTVRNLTHVEGMSLDALREGVQWNFTSFPEYLAFLEQRGVGPNVASFIGHSSVRTYVMGIEASQRHATPDEVQRMAAIVEDAMQAGAVGFSSTTADQHNGEHGIPMPSRLADTPELEALTGVLGKVGKGLFMTTRGNGTPISSIEDLARRNGRPALISGFLHNPANPEKHVRGLAELAAARGRGVQLVGAVTCCPLTMDFTMRSAYMLEAFPTWKPAMQAHGDEELRKLYADAAFRAAVKQELEALRGTRLFNSEWDKINVVEAAKPGNAGLEGRTIADIAAERGTHPLDCLLDLALEENFDTLLSAVLLNSDPEVVGEIIKDPENYITLSDAGAHITFFCDAGFGLHLLGYWVRERGLMQVEEAVERLTQQPAKLFGITGRGTLRVGNAADLLLFDPQTVGRGKNQRVHDFPAGAARLVTPALGVHGVWINGERVVLDAQGTLASDRKPGRVLREFHQ